MTEPKKIQAITIRIPRELAEEARGAVHVIPGLTLTALFERAISSYVSTLRRRNNRGQAFKPRAALPPGRR